MKYFPKNAKASNGQKKSSQKKVKPAILQLEPANLTEGFDCRYEFEELVKKLYNKLSPEFHKKLWLITSSIIYQNRDQSTDLRQQLKLAIEQAHKSLTK